MVDDHLVEIITTKVRVTRSGENFKHSISNFQHRHVKGAASKVEHENAFIAFFVEAVGQRSGCGLVNDAQDFQACDLSGVFCGLALGIVEISGNGNDRLGHGFTEVLTSIFSKFAQNLGAHLLRGELLLKNRTFNFDVGSRFLDRITHLFGFIIHFVYTTSNETFDGIKRVIGVHHRLTLCDLTDQLILIFCVGHHRWSGAKALSIGDHGGLAALHHRDTTVGGT